MIPADRAPHRVLLVRTSAMGDVVHCLPVATALRRHWPEVRIGWVVEQPYAPLVAGLSAVDEVLPVRLRAWRRLPLTTAHREVRAFRAALEDFRADVALDLMGNHKGGLLAFLSGAPRRLGLARGLRREPSSAAWINRPVTPPGLEATRHHAGGPPLHAVDRALALLPALGLPAGEPADFAPQEIFSPDRFPAAAPPADAAERPYAALHPGAGWANKVYPPAAWATVARRLAAAAGLETRVAVGPGEEALAEAVVEAAGGAARPVPAAGLPALAGLFRGARLVLGGDTGPLHLAHALGAPVLAVLGPTDPHRHGPYAAPERAVWRTLPCSFCYKRLKEIKACLSTLPAEQVSRRALALLADGPEGEADILERRNRPVLET